MDQCEKQRNEKQHGTCTSTSFEIHIDKDTVQTHCVPSEVDKLFRNDYKTWYVRECIPYQGPKEKAERRRRKLVAKAEKRREAVFIRKPPPNFGTEIAGMWKTNIDRPHNLVPFGFAANPRYALRESNIEIEDQECNDAFLEKHVFVRGEYIVIFNGFNHTFHHRPKRDDKKGEKAPYKFVLHGNNNIGKSTLMWLLLELVPRMTQKENLNGIVIEFYTRAGKKEKTDHLKIGYVFFKPNTEYCRIFSYKRNRGKESIDQKDWIFFLDGACVYLTFKWSGHSLMFTSSDGDKVLPVKGYSFTPYTLSPWTIPELVAFKCYMEINATVNKQKYSFTWEEFHRRVWLAGGTVGLIFPNNHRAILPVCPKEGNNMGTSILNAIKEASKSDDIHSIVEKFGNPYDAKPPPNRLFVTHVFYKLGGEKIDVNSQWLQNSPGAEKDHIPKATPYYTPICESAVPVMQAEAINASWRMLRQKHKLSLGSERGNSFETLFFNEASLQGIHLMASRLLLQDKVIKELKWWSYRNMGFFLPPEVVQKVPSFVNYGKQFEHKPPVGMCLRPQKTNEPSFDFMSIVPYKGKLLVVLGQLTISNTHRCNEQRLFDIMHNYYTMKKKYINKDEWVYPKHMKKGQEKMDLPKRESFHVVYILENSQAFREKHNDSHYTDKIKENVREKYKEDEFTRQILKKMKKTAFWKGEWLPGLSQMTEVSLVATHKTMQKCYEDPVSYPFINSCQQPEEYMQKNLTASKFLSQISYDYMYITKYLIDKATEDRDSYLKRHFIIPHTESHYRETKALLQKCATSEDLADDLAKAKRRLEETERVDDEALLRSLFEKAKERVTPQQRKEHEVTALVQDVHPSILEELLPVGTGEISEEIQEEIFKYKWALEHGWYGYKDVPPEEYNDENHLKAYKCLKSFNKNFIDYKCGKCKHLKHDKYDLARRYFQKRLAFAEGGNKVYSEPVLSVLPSS